MRSPLCRFSEGPDSPIQPNHRCEGSDADRPGCLEVDDQVKVNRLLHGKVSRFGTLDDLVDEARRLPKHVDYIRSVHHESPGFDELGKREHAGQTLLIGIAHDIACPNDGHGIRRRGIASRARSSAAQNTVAREFSALDAPVFDHTGRIKAGLTEIGQSPGFDESVSGPTAAIVRTAAERLSAQLGYVG